MEQHPVPQNVTSFEFRLIGDMTLKQFAFLATAAILAYIVWELPLPDIIRIPTALTLALAGTAFAFLPLQDRPLHRWALSFLKSVYSPTQYLFQKSEVIPSYLREDFLAATQKMVPVFQIKESRQKLEEYLKTLPRSLPTALDTKEATSLTKISALLGTIAAMPTPYVSPMPHIKLSFSTSPLNLKLRRGFPPPATPSAQREIPPEKPQAVGKKKLAFAEGGKLLFEEEKKNVPTIPFSPTKITSRSELLTEEIKRLKRAIADLHLKPPSPTTATKEVQAYEEELRALEDQLEQAERGKEALTRMMLRLQKEMTSRPKGVTPTEVLEGPQTVKIVSAQAAKKVGLTKLTDIPGVITGVIQDKKGVFLPNILVEVKDRAGNSVRAFKTNKLGQFAAATPLGNGTYNLELEDPRHEYIFDIIELTVDGSVLPPLAIYAKGQADIEREKIHGSLFGSNG